MKLLIVFLIGMLFGVIAMYLRCLHFMASGNLIVDSSDSETEPYLFLELTNGDLKKIQRSKIMIINIKLKKFFPHK